MPFEWRVFELAKEPEHPDENQDAWWLDAEGGVAAVADGVTSGIFSRPWARILTRAAVEDRPDPGDEGSFSAWLGGLRAQWEREIDTTGLAWYQRAKLREGGFSTLLWLHLADNEALREAGEDSRLRATAIGDSCLFHVRDDELLESFPLDASLQFDSSPLVLGSVDLKRDDQLEFQRIELTCRLGDLLVLCTDAVAAWALDRQEKGEPVAWSRYWEMSAEAWAEEVHALRGESKMRYDDATLLLLRVSRVAGGRPEDYTPPVVALSDTSGAGEESDAVLLAADDWGESMDTESAVAEPRGAESSSDTEEVYALHTPEPEAPSNCDGPPPLPPGIGVNSAPPPPPEAAPDRDDDWREQVNSFSERMFKKLTQGLSRGADRLEEAKKAAMKRLGEKGDTSSEEEPDERGR